MIKNLVRHGNSWALVIDKPILDLLQIDPAVPLELSTDGRVLHVTPAQGPSGRDRLRVVSRKVNARYRKAFKKLAE